MSAFEAFLLGLIQGLTEFLPVSSSGHLELGQVLLGLETSENLTFAVIVHAATVLSTIVVFYQEIVKLLQGTFTPKWNEEKTYVAKILVSMIPVGIVGVFFKEEVEVFFTGNLVFVGSMLAITALLLSFSNYAKDRDKNISYFHALIIGIAQAFAVLPGISRAGATISTGLLLGNKRAEIAKFSFLMVLVPIIAANTLDLMDAKFATSNIGIVPLIIGFVSAFVSGLLACRWMIAIVK
ncbi:MAG: undecaprenyl-diphosphate phosphatase, partial [Bacteroidota bacterium]